MQHTESSSTESTKHISKLAKIGAHLRRVFSASKSFDKHTKEQLEDILLMSDVGPQATDKIISALEKGHAKKSLQNPIHTLEQIIADTLKPREVRLLPDSGNDLHTLLIIGANGVGKTTSLAKLAHYYANIGYKPIIAAGDTFRVAAIEQIKNWAERLHIDVISHHQGSDSPAVIFDAIHAAKARGKNLVLADTAGRLHNKQHLLDELGRIHKVAKKAAAHNTVHNLLILDAATGLSAVEMVKLFGQTMPLAGVMITKLDSGAKAGSLLAMDEKFAVPIAFLGTGEQLEDIQVFRADTFAQQLLA